MFLPSKVFGRLPMLAALILLGVGLWGGLTRLGFSSLPATSEIYLFHGAIMVGGFLGTLIGFERAVALDWNWPFFVPVSTVVGGAWIAGGGPPFWGAVSITLGSIVMVAVFGFLYKIQPSDHGLGLMVGSVCWVIGNVLWLAGWQISELVYWWMGFLVLTIAAERLELNRLMKITGWKRFSFFLGFYGFIAGLVIHEFWPRPGLPVSGLSLAVLALWLARYDLARHTLYRGGEQGYSAWSMFVGYFWLIVGGIFLILFPLQQAGFYYDATIHAVFIGFVFSMIFGHALIIFPNVIGRSIPFRSVLFFPLVLLHGGLVLRIAGDLAGWMPGRIWGGAINGLAIVLFFVFVVCLIGFVEESEK